MFALHVNSITTSRVEFAFIDVQLYSSMIAIFLQRHFLIELNGPRFGLGLYLFLILCTSAISRCWIFWGRSFFILMKGLFFFLTGTNSVPVEIELVPGFVSLSSPHRKKGWRELGRTAPFISHFGVEQFPF